MRIDCYLLGVIRPAIDLRGPETPEFADTQSGDDTFPRHPLQGFGVNAKQRRRFVTFEKRLERFRDIGGIEQ
jgi:hypothetical protein